MIVYVHMTYIWHTSDTPLLLLDWLLVSDQTIGLTQMLKKDFELWRTRPRAKQAIKATVSLLRRPA